MKPAARFALIGLAAAALVAIAASLYLRKSHQAVQRVVQPVELSAPDLFPTQTLLYAEMQGWDRSYARAEAWWRRFEETATWLGVQRGWKENHLGLPEGVVEMLANVDKELDRAKEKFGYRPTTREFFESYGKHIAVGVLPSPKGERPRFLLATRLPDDAPRALQGYLSKAGGVKPCDPPLHKGFPIYQEQVTDVTVYYGVGRGYLFVSDALPEMRSALERLALATDEKKKPDGTLAHDPVLARVRPPKDKKESGVIWLRRDQKLAEWKPELSPVDAFIKNAFVLAPKDDAVAFSLPDGPDGEVRCSFHDSAPKPWTKSLPPGLIYLEATVPPPAGELKKVRDAETARVFDKPLWKELDAFLSDPKQVKEFLAEAIPAKDRPDDELASRIPNDVRLLGAWMKEWLLEAVEIEAPHVALAAKTYPGIDSDPRAQFAVGIDLDPFSVFLIAGGLDYARSTWPEWLVRDERPGVLSWRLNMQRALQELRENAPEELAEIIENFFAPLGPSLLIAGNRVILVLGEDFAKEIAAGGKSFEDDPLYVEARGQVRPAFVHVTWDRPFERIKAGYGAVLDWVGTILEKSGQDEETQEFIHAGLKTIERAIGWAKPSRAVLSAAYLDSAKPYESVELVDPEAEKAAPRLVPEDAVARSPDLLPADTWLYGMQRVELKPSYDALRAAFVEALPGGEERLKQMSPPEEAKKLIDAVVDGIVRNVKGEVGFAIATPHPKAGPGEAPGMGSFMARWPALIAFVEFEKPADGFMAIRNLMELLHGEMTPDPERTHRGFFSEFKVGVVGEHRAAALDFYIPMGGPDHAVVSLCAVERSGFVFLTTSGEVLKRFGSAKEKDADSLSARLPAIPEKSSALGVFHGDTLIQQVRLFTELGSRAGIMLTLGGYEEGPPPDRVQAHIAGWTRWTDLVLDLFRTDSWIVSSTVRTGNVVRTKTVVVPEK